MPHSLRHRMTAYCEKSTVVSPPWPAACSMSLQQRECASVSPGGAHQPRRELHALARAVNLDLAHVSVAPVLVIGEHHQLHQVCTHASRRAARRRRRRARRSRQRQVDPAHRLCQLQRAQLLKCQRVVTSSAETQKGCAKPSCLHILDAVPGAHGERFGRVALVLLEVHAQRQLLRGAEHKHSVTHDVSCVRACLRAGAAPAAQPCAGRRCSRCAAARRPT